MKKILLIMAILIFSVPLFVGCGNDNDVGVKPKLEDTKWVLNSYGEKGR